MHVYVLFKAFLIFFAEQNLQASINRCHEIDILVTIQVPYLSGEARSPKDEGMNTATVGNMWVAFKRVPSSSLFPKYFPLLANITFM